MITTTEITGCTVTNGGVAIKATFFGGDPKSFAKSIVRALHREIATKVLAEAKRLSVSRPEASAALQEYAVSMLTTDPWPES